MAFSFFCTVKTQLTGCSSISETSVFQKLQDGKRKHVAFIYDEYCGGVNRRTKVLYNGGSLYFEADYDGPIREHGTDEFCAENNQPLVTMHFFCRILQYYLEYNRRFYRIYNNELDNITVYEPAPIQKQGMLCYRPVATITSSGDGFYTYFQRTGEWGYECYLNCELDMPLCMAIISLPFTFGEHFCSEEEFMRLLKKSTKKGV